MHFPVLIAVFGLREHLPFHLNSGEGMMIVLAGVVLVSHVVFHYYERPAQRLFRKTLGKIAF